MADIRPNRVKRKLQEGKCATVIGGVLNAEVADFLGQFGFDAIWIDTEHGPYGWEEAANMSRACDVWGMTPIARVGNNDNALITRTLDMGATGIAVPHVITREQAEQAAKSIKYPPDGTRGMAAGRQSYGVAGFHPKANAETLMVAFIEDFEAVDNLDGILKVDGIDVFLVGAGDMSASMGYTGQQTHPEVVAVVDKCIDKIVAAGKIAGAVVPEDALEKRIAQGVRYMLLVWHPWVIQGANRYLTKLGELSPKG